MKGDLAVIGMKRVARGLVLGVVAACIASLVVAGVTWALLEYWNGHMWPYPRSQNIKYRIYDSVPSHLRQSMVNAANTWSQPSSRYKLYRTYDLPSWGEGGAIYYRSFSPTYLCAYVDPRYQGDQMKYFYMHFNANCKWTQYCWFLDYYDIQAASVHEFGHVTDFISVDDTDTVMYRYQRNCVRSLYPRDADNLRALYGW